MNKHAQALGRLSKGRPKTITEAERVKRRLRMAKAREYRIAKIKEKQWPSPPKPKPH